MMVRAAMKNHKAIQRMQACGTYFTVEAKAGSKLDKKSIASLLKGSRLTLDKFSTAQKAAEVTKPPEVADETPKRATEPKTDVPETPQPEATRTEPPSPTGRTSALR